jgi:flagellin-like hook-associated protein FlgL
MNKKNTKSAKSTKSNTVSREAFERAVSDIYVERARLAEMKETTVSRERFDRAISDIRRLRAELASAYAAGASAVLNSDIVSENVPAKVRRNLRPSRFAKKAQRKVRQATSK